MTGSRGAGETETPFLRVEDAEIVHGPSVIADKVSGALRDADRFDLPSVKPPLGEALDRTERAGSRMDPRETGPNEQNALEGKPAEIDEAAGSAEKLQPDAARQT